MKFQKNIDKFRFYWKTDLLFRERCFHFLDFQEMGTSSRWLTFFPKRFEWDFPEYGDLKIEIYDAWLFFMGFFLPARFEELYGERSKNFVAFLAGKKCGRNGEIFRWWRECLNHPNGEGAFLHRAENLRIENLSCKEMLAMQHGFSNRFSALYFHDGRRVDDDSRFCFSLGKSLRSPGIIQIFRAMEKK